MIYIAGFLFVWDNYYETLQLLFYAIPIEQPYQFR